MHFGIGAIGRIPVFIIFVTHQVLVAIMQGISSQAQYDQNELLWRQFSHNILYVVFLTPSSSNRAINSISNCISRKCYIYFIFTLYIS